jgi:glycosidase
MKYTKYEMKYLKLILLFISLQSTMLNAQNKTYWWNDQVFYEIFVRSFYDSNGNGIGDFKGLMQKLDYLNDGNSSTTTDLGVTALWLMPIMESPSYHGYDVTDYKKIEQDYGTNQDFQTFLDSAHARGIKVIIDLVLNHTSNQHSWFQNSKSGTNSTYRNWYVWKNSNPGTGGWYNNGGYYYYAAFGSGMPDLNYFNQEVKSEVNNIVKYWLDTVKVDGFRLDAIKYICEEGNVTQNAPSTFAYLREFRNYYKSVNPDAMAVGEAWSSTQDVLPYVDGTGIDFCFEFETAMDIINAINIGDPAALSIQINNVVKSYPFLQYGTFLTNHDQVRIFSQLGNSVGKSKLAAGVLLTLPGIPFIYYGEEIGMTSNSDDPSKRTPMQWTGGTNAGFTTGTPWHSIPSTFQTSNVQTMSSDTISLLSSYKKLIRIREQSSSLRRGSYIPLTSTFQGIYAFGRYEAEDNDLIFPIHNFSAGTIINPQITAENSGLPAGAYKLSDLITRNDAGMLFIDNNGKIYSTPNISLASYSSSILKAELLTGINNNKEETMLKSFMLYQNYPNPFNPGTTITFEIPSTGLVKLKVYNLLGQEVKTLVNRNMGEGMHAVKFDGKNLINGLYIYKLESGGYSQTRKMILMK